MKFFQDFLQTWSWGEILLTLVFATAVFVIIFCCTCRKYTTLGSRFVSRPVDPDRKQPPAGDDNQKPCGTEPAEAGKIGLAVVIANEYEGENKLKGTAKDKQRWEEALRNLQFDVRTSKKVGLNANKTEMLRLIESLSQIHIRDADVPHCRNIAFVFSGHGYSGGIFSQDLEQLNLESDVFPLLFREKFDSRRKFIFVDACRTTESGQKGFEITASMIPKGSSKPNVIGVGAFVAYATLDRLAATDLKDGSHFSKFTTEEIQNNNTISAALDKAIGKVDKQPVKYYTRPTYVNQLSGELNLYKEAGCIFQLKRFIKGWIPWFKRDTGTQAAPVNPTPQPPPSQPHPPVPQPAMLTHATDDEDDDPEDEFISVEDLLPYLVKLSGKVMLIGVALGMKDFTIAELDKGGDPQEACLRVFGHYFDQKQMTRKELCEVLRLVNMETLANEIAGMKAPCQVAEADCSTTEKPDCIKQSGPTKRDHVQHRSHSKLGIFLNALIAVSICISGVVMLLLFYDVRLKPKYRGTPPPHGEVHSNHFARSDDKLPKDRKKPEKKLKVFLKEWMRRIKSDAETQACVQDLFQEQVISEGVSTDIKNAKTRREANGLLYQHLRNQATVETMLKLYEVWDTWHGGGNGQQKKLSGEMRADMDKYQIKN